VEIWDGIDEYIKKINQEKANQLEKLLSKERWSEDDRKNINSLLRFFRTNV